jgi:hypothetical protein
MIGYWRNFLLPNGHPKGLPTESGCPVLLSNQCVRNYVAPALLWFRPASPFPGEVTKTGRRQNIQKGMQRSSRQVIVNQPIVTGGSANRGTRWRKLTRRNPFGRCARSRCVCTAPGGHVEQSNRWREVVGLKCKA